MLACLEGHAAVAEKLLEAGAQPNATTHDGRTALMAAAQRGGRELAAILLRAGADAAATRPDGSTALQYAAQHGATDTIESLLGAGAAVDAARADGRTALLAACQNGHAAAGIQLLAAGADATAACGEHTALHLASDGYASADAVSMGALVLALLKAKAPIEAKARGATPLARAAQLGATEVARALVAGGAVVDAVDEDLYMPLMLASANGHRDTAALLLEAGADASYRRGHDTAFSLARDHKHEDVLALLRGVEEEHGRRMSTTAQAVRGSI